MFLNYDFCIGTCVQLWAKTRNFHPLASALVNVILALLPNLKFLLSNLLIFRFSIVGFLTIAVLAQSVNEVEFLDPIEDFRFEVTFFAIPRFKVYQQIEVFRFEVAFFEIPPF